MKIFDAEVDQASLNLELVTTSIRIAEPYEKAYQWMATFGSQMHPQETVGTIAFSNNGENKVSHLTWAELVSHHQAYQRLIAIEHHLKAREIATHLVAAADVQ